MKNTNKKYVYIFRSIQDLKRYVVSFWNAVDLRYRIFDEPKIRFHVSGIIVVEVSNINKNA